MSYLCHIEDEIPSLGRLLVDLKELRTFHIAELKDLTDLGLKTIKKD